MTMGKSEIVREYKQAKNPKEQIKILAELNCCTVEVIKGVLSEAGIDVNKRGRKPKTPETPIKTQRGGISAVKTEKGEKIAPKIPTKPIKTQAEDDFGEVEEIEEIIEPSSYPEEVEETIREVLHKELFSLETNIRFHENKIKELNAKYEHITSYLGNRRA